MDEFDKIIGHIAMMQATAGLTNDVVAHHDRIMEIFKRRSTRHEFAAASFSVYL